jgi:hypothetical protein
VIQMCFFCRITMPESSSPSERDQRLERILADYMHAVEAGTPPDCADLLAQCGAKAKDGKTYGLQVRDLTIGRNHFKVREKGLESMESRGYLGRTACPADFYPARLDAAPNKDPVQPGRLPPGCHRCVGGQDLECDTAR